MSTLAERLAAAREHQRTFGDGSLRGRRAAAERLLWLLLDTHHPEPEPELARTAPIRRTVFDSDPAERPQLDRRTAELAAKIPAGVRVVIATDPDGPGETYARRIAATLAGRCELMRLVLPEGLRDLERGALRRTARSWGVAAVRGGAGGSPGGQTGVARPLAARCSTAPLLRA